MANFVTRLIGELGVRDRIAALRNRTQQPRADHSSHAVSTDATDWDRIGQGIADRYPNTLAELAK